MPSPLPDDLTFEQALTRLEAITAQLETDETTLETALSLYEEGVALAQYCRQRLDTAEMRLQELAME